MFSSFKALTKDILIYSFYPCFSIHRRNLKEKRFLYFSDAWKSLTNLHLSITRELMQRFSTLWTTSCMARVTNLFFNVILGDPSQRSKLYKNSSEHKSAYRGKSFALCMECRRNVISPLILSMKTSMRLQWRKHFK